MLHALLTRQKFGAVNGIASLTTEEILLESQDIIEETLSGKAEDGAVVMRHSHQKEKGERCISSLERASILLQIWKRGDHKMQTPNHII